MVTFDRALPRLIAWIVESVLQGESMRAVAQRYGLTARTVHHIYHRDAPLFGGVLPRKGAGLEDRMGESLAALLEASGLMRDEATALLAAFVASSWEGCEGAVIHVLREDGSTPTYASSGELAQRLGGGAPGVH